MLTDYLLHSNKKIILRQKRELVELFGFETRNKYSIEDESGNEIGFAAEQGKGIFGWIGRQILGHWRPFQIHIFNLQKKMIYIAHHPFRVFFQRLDINDAAGNRIGSLQQKFAIIYKKFHMLDSSGNVLLEMSAPRWRIWTFPIKKNDIQVALILKKWSGLFKEVLTDTDNFSIDFQSPNLTAQEKELIFISGLFIDIIYFENKANQS
jgi:hypothetical protein